MKKFSLITITALLTLIGAHQTVHSAWYNNWNNLKNKFGYGQPSEVTDQWEENIPFEEQRVKSREYLDKDIYVKASPTLKYGLDKSYDVEQPEYLVNISPTPGAKPQVKKRMVKPGYTASHGREYWNELYRREHGRNYEPGEYKEVKSLNPKDLKKLMTHEHISGRKQGTEVGFKYGKHLGRYEGARNAALVGAGIVGAAALGYGAYSLYQWARGPLHRYNNGLKIAKKSLINAQKIAKNNFDKEGKIEETMNRMINDIDQISNIVTQAKKSKK